MSKRKLEQFDQAAYEAAIQAARESAEKQLHIPFATAREAMYFRAQFYSWRKAIQMLEGDASLYGDIVLRLGSDKSVLIICAGFTHGRLREVLKAANVHIEGEEV